VGALAAYRKTTAMPEPLVRANLDLALDVLGNFAPQITFDRQIRIDVLADPHDLTVGEIPNLGAPIDPEIIENGMRTRQANTKNVGEPNLNTLVSWKVGSGNTSHKTITPVAAYGVGWNKPPTRAHAGG
jgi:hypothetical protein